MSTTTFKLYVKLLNGATAVPVETNTSQDVFTFVQAIKNKVSRLKDVDDDLITLHSGPDTDAFLPDLSIAQLVASFQTKNSGSNPLLVKVHNAAESALHTSQEGQTRTQIRFKEKILHSYMLHYNDLRNLRTLKEDLLGALKRAEVFWDKIFLKYRKAGAKERDAWTTLNRINFAIAQDPGTIYASDVEEIPKDISSYDLTTDEYRAKLIQRITSSIVTITDDIMKEYDNFGFHNGDHKELSITLHRLMLTGAVVILDESQSAKHVLEAAISVKEPMYPQSKGKFLVLGTPRLGASRQIDLDRNNENKLMTLLDVPPLSAIEMITYAQYKLQRQLSSEEVAYLYAISGGHIRLKTYWPPQSS